MPTFTYSFTVPAPRPAVAAFHRDTRVLKRLSPPPIFIQLHRFEPLAENSEASFTMWFGPIPLRWRAVHTGVGPEGFTDTQLAGPLDRWQHKHRFTALDGGHTRIEEHIIFEHAPGFKGTFTRLFFNRPALTLLFTYRQLVTRLALREQAPAGTRRRWPTALVAVFALFLIIRLWSRFRQWRFS